MLHKSLLAAVVLALVLLVTGLLGTVFPVVLLVVALLPLVVMAVARMFRHAPGSGGARRGPTTPSTSAASYEPVEDPSRR